MAYAELKITEVMAVADLSFPDEDGAPSDWIEISNTGPAAAPLDGHYLTNSIGDPTRWAFPAGVSIPSGSRLVVFASGKDRAPVPGQLHTSFTLDAGGDYVGLIAPDGNTVVSEISPAYPQQFAGISYGIGPAAGAAEVFVPLGSDIRYHVQDDDGSDLLGDTWKQPPGTFDDSGWSLDPGPLGFESGLSGNLWNLINTNIAPTMKGVNASGLFRFPFNYDATGKSIVGMQLKVFIDDAFVAYLNGVEIGEFAKPNPLTWTSGVGSSPRSDSVSVSTPITIDVGGFAGSVIDGQNVLAIQGINTGAGGSDFVIDAELSATVVETALSEVLGYLETPSPGATNGEVKGEPPADIVFSETSKLFTGSFELTLSCATPGARIRYTTDLSEPSNTPGAESPEYTGPITINSSTQVRAKAYLEGSIDGATRAETFLRMSGNVPSFSSDLPVIVMSTLGGGSPPSSGSNTRVPTYMFFFEPDPATGRTVLTGMPEVATRAGARKRGSSSAGWPKYSMSIETWQDGSDEDRNVSPYGFGSEADWVLSGRWRFDLALIRNPFIYELSNQVGRYAVGTRFVELYNDVTGGDLAEGDYFGVYTFMERIESDGDRVDITQIEPWENAEPEITGGYIFKNDRGDRVMNVGGFQNNLVPHYPDVDQMSTTQRSWLTSHLNEANTALLAANGINASTGKHFSEYLDIGSFIDNQLLNALAMDPDWGRLSQYFFKDRNGLVNAGPVWDYDRTMGSRDGRDNDPLRWEAPTNDTSFMWFDNEYQWFGRILGFSSTFTNGQTPPPGTSTRPDMLQLLIDRWAEMRDGACSTSNMHAIIDSMAAEIEEAQARNFVKWTQHSPGSGTNYADAGLSGWDAEISHLKGWLETRANWMDSQFLARPTFNSPDGVVPGGFGLTMSSPASGVWYTLDGSDPRAPGGAPAAGAIQYPGAAVSITSTRLVTARSRNSNADWSAPMQVALVVSDEAADNSNLVVSEVMYRPARPSDTEIAAGFDDRDDFEYLELLNISAGPVALVGTALIDGVLFDFNNSPIMLLGPGERALVVKDQAAFELRYGTTHSGRIVGEFQGDTQLSNDGEQVVLAGFGAAVIRDFTYNDRAPWPEAADGDGYSLVLIAPETNPDHAVASSWRSSVGMGGTPGFADADTFANWSAANGGIGAGSDDDNDLRDALREYAEGTLPDSPDAETMRFGTMSFEVEGLADEYLTITLPRNLAADDVTMTPEISSALGTWTPFGGALVLVEETNLGDGTATLLYRTALPVGQLPEGSQFWRLRYSER